MASLSDTARFPEGSVLEIVREYEYLGVPMCDVRVDFYKFSRVADGTYYLLGTDYLGRDLLTRLFRVGHASRS